MKKRVVDSLRRRNLQALGAVPMVGPKLCGKSTTATMQAKSVLFMEPGRTLQIAARNPKPLLEGDVPRPIDERQGGRPELQKMPPLSIHRHAEAERFPLMKTRICGRGFEAKSPERIRSGKMPLKLSLGRRLAVVSDAHDSPEILMSIPALGPRAASSCSAGAPAAPMRIAE